MQRAIKSPPNDDEGTANKKKEKTHIGGANHSCGKSFTPSL